MEFFRGFVNRLLKEEKGGIKREREGGAEGMEF